MQLSKNVFVRYEPEMNSGTVYVFNKKEEKVFKSQGIVYEVLKNIEGNEVDQICKIIHRHYSDYTFVEIEKTVLEIIEDMKKRGVIVI